MWMLSCVLKYVGVNYDFLKLIPYFTNFSEVIF